MVPSGELKPPPDLGVMSWCPFQTQVWCQGKPAKTQELNEIQSYNALKCPDKITCLTQNQKDFKLNEKEQPIDSQHQDYTVIGQIF